MANWHEIYVCTCRKQKYETVSADAGVERDVIKEWW